MGRHRYFYLTNLQGDVTAIITVGGTTVVEYTYDAWGNVLSIEGTRKDNLGKLNPLRYRGYIYDEETRLYYLQSRYYDPELGRFINADVYTSTGQGLLGNNMFAYCNNNPVVHKDSTGTAVDTVFDVVSLGFSIVDVAADPKNPWAWIGLAGDLLDVVIPFVGGIGETVDAFIAVRRVADSADKISDTGKAAEATIKSARSSAVRKAWKNEVDQVMRTGRGTRDWTQEQLDELLTTGKVKGFVGHHMKSVKGYPDLAGDPSNIQFLTRQEHLSAHGGNWRNITHGRYIS